VLPSTSLAQQKVIKVPFDNTVVSGSPIEVTGQVLVQETIAGNQVSSAWEENVTAKNISPKPILLLLGILDAIGPYSDGGYELRIDRFFSQDVIPPQATIPVASGTTLRGACCINPLGEAQDPKADFRVLFVQFLDGSTFGDPDSAQDVLKSRASALHDLRELIRAYLDHGADAFQSRLEQAHGIVFMGIRRTKKEEGADAAISQARKMLAIAEEHQAKIGKRSSE
jgi:hypothetical protein